MLSSLSGELEKAKKFVEAKNESVEDLMEARLAPDMFPLSMQVRFVCIQALLAISKLTGKEMVDGNNLDSFGDGFEDIKSLLSTTSDFVSSIKEEDMDNEDINRKITLDLPNKMSFEMTALEFVRDWTTAQFYFHLVTAYAIMRNKGVDLGKADYVRYMFRYSKQENNNPVE